MRGEGPGSRRFSDIIPLDRIINNSRRVSRHPATMESTTTECAMGSSSTDDCPVSRHSLDSDSRQASESLAALLEKEHVYARSDYLASSSTCRVTADDRLKIADWKYSVADSCQVSNANCAMAERASSGRGLSRFAKPGR